MPVWGDRGSLWLCPVWATRLQIPRGASGMGAAGGVSLARTTLSPAPPPRPPPPAPPPSPASTRPQEPCWSPVASRSAALSLSPP